MNLDEFQWIDSIKPKEHRQDTLIQGIGDDAALVATNPSFDQIVCVDTMVEHVHFLRKTLSPFDIGYKALAINISDIAAMGGIPLYFLVSLAVPKDWNEKELAELYDGMDKVAETFHMDLIGGDTVSTPGPLVVSVTAIGHVEQGRQLLRDKARPGDVVFVTGSLGSSAAGLDQLLKYTRHASFGKMEDTLIRAHQRPQPQVKAGRIIAQCSSRTALNDISDGLASEAAEIAEASNVSIVLEWERLPYAEELSYFEEEQRLSYMLYGGEDFQLVGTVEKIKWPLLHKELNDANIQAVKIGTVKKGQGVFLKKAGKTYRLQKKGYNHFRK